MFVKVRVYLILTGLALSIYGVPSIIISNSNILYISVSFVFMTNLFTVSVYHKLVG